MIAQYLVTAWYCEAVDSYWHEDDDCDWSGEYDISRRSEILDMQVEKTLMPFGLGMKMELSHTTFTGECVRHQKWLTWLEPHG
ncbi:MAG: hypothetical protein CM15mV29_0310 [uncultured marine virus]|nr:MAG: hypothetical protein CM15mV29_0310 [uncultured marine virus]